MSTPSIRSEKARAGRKMPRGRGRAAVDAAQIDLEDYLRELTAREHAAPAH